MLGRGLTQHPAMHTCKSAVRLSNHENLQPLVAVTTLYRNAQTVPRMEPIENPPLGLLIPGSMSLLRPAPANPGWLARSDTKPAGKVSRCCIGVRPGRLPRPPPPPGGGGGWGGV